MTAPHRFRKLETLTAHVLKEHGQGWVSFSAMCWMQGIRVCPACSIAAAGREMVAMINEAGRALVEATRMERAIDVGDGTPELDVKPPDRPRLGKTGQ